MVDLVDIKNNYHDITKYSIKFLRGNTMMITKDLLNSRNVPYIVYTPISSEDYINESKNLTQ